MVHNSGWHLLQSSRKPCRLQRRVASSVEKRWHSRWRNEQPFRVCSPPDSFIPASPTWLSINLTDAHLSCSACSARTAKLEFRQLHLLETSQLS